MTKIGTLASELSGALLLTDRTGPIFENYYRDQSCLTLDLETLTLVVKGLVKRDEITWGNDDLLPKLICLKGKGVQEATLFVDPTVTYLELLEIRGQIDKEPYGLFLDSSYGSFQLWDNIKLKTIGLENSNFGVIHCVPDKSDLPFIWSTLFTHYECHRCLACDCLRRGLSTKDKNSHLLDNDFYRRLSTEEGASTFDCTLVENFIRSHHEVIEVCNV